MIHFEDTGDTTPDSLLGQFALVIWIVAAIVVIALIVVAMFREARIKHERMVELQQEAINARNRRLAQPVFNQEED